jgi:hypothetical protein
MKGFLSLLILLAAAAGLQRLLVRLVRTVLLSHSPLSGDQSDSVVYHRSLLTPGDPDNRIIVGLVAACGLCVWLAIRHHAGWGWLAVLLLLGSVGWDLWTWERAAVSVRLVSWRRGWRKSVRRVPVSQVAEVVVTEKPHPWLKGELGTRLGSCYLRLQLRTGDALRLPRTSALTGATQLEDVANFLRLQMGAADEEKRRTAHERRRKRETTVGQEAAADQEEMERRLASLRRERAATTVRDIASEDTMPPYSQPPDSWPPDSMSPDSQSHSIPPHSVPPRGGRSRR